jgi:TonB family protein
LTRAIVHELEHVKRGDWLSHCFARAVCAVYWFHPLVWIALRRLALEAERSCDDAVLRRSEATAYADQLVGIAQRLSSAKSPLLAMANRADLATRVRAALDSRQRRGRAGARAVALACLGAAALILTMSPLRMVAASQSAGVDITATATPTRRVLPVAEHTSAVKGRNGMSPLRMVAMAQSEAPSAPVPRFSANAQLVTAPVTVSDNSGKSIHGLGPKDFVVTEDGVTQVISIFESRTEIFGAMEPQDYYILGYYPRDPNMDTAFRKIQITLRGDATAKLRHRSGYYAAKPITTDLASGNGVVNSTGTGAPALLFKFEPEYSDEARIAKWQGTVVLGVNIDASGQVTDIKVTRSLGLGLDEKAIEAVKKWKFKPGTKDGQPVPAQAQVDVNFRLL